MDTQNQSDQEVKQFMIESIVSVLREDIPEATVETIFTHDGHRALFKDVLIASINEIELKELQHHKTDHAVKLMKEIKYVLDHRKSTFDMLEKAIGIFQYITAYRGTPTGIQSIAEDFLKDYKAWGDLSNV